MSASTPPLLMLVEGREPRLRKSSSYQAKEFALHVAVVSTLRRFARPDWQWCHIPSGELRNKRTAAKLKAMGTRPGWSDFILISPAGILHALELKRVGGVLSDRQEDFATWCGLCGVPHRVARNVGEALAAFSAWGCLRVEIRTS
jgi:hypothetical protein